MKREDFKDIKVMITRDNIKDIMNQGQSFKEEAKELVFLAMKSQIYL